MKRWLGVAMVVRGAGGGRQLHDRAARVRATAEEEAVTARPLTEPPGTRIVGSTWRR